MKKFLWPYPFLLLALPLGGPALGQGEASARVQAGDISATAQGEGAKATVNIGALPTTGKPGCGVAEVRVGNIQKTALGRNAVAQVNIPETHCKEKHP